MTDILKPLYATIAIGVLACPSSATAQMNEEAGNRICSMDMGAGACSVDVEAKAVNATLSGIDAETESLLIQTACPNVQSGVLTEHWTFDAGWHLNLISNGNVILRCELSQMN